MGAFLSGSSADRKKGNPLGLMSTVSPHISDIFCLNPQSMAVLLNFNTIWRHNNILKAVNGSSAIFALSNYATFS
jgi:hypothetical protein